MGIKVMEKRNDSITHEEVAIPIKRIGCIGMARNESKAAKVVRDVYKRQHHSVVSSWKAKRVVARRG